MIKEWSIVEATGSWTGEKCWDVFFHSSGSHGKPLFMRTFYVEEDALDYVKRRKNG